MKLGAIFGPVTLLSVTILLGSRFVARFPVSCDLAVTESDLPCALNHEQALSDGPDVNCYRLESAVAGERVCTVEPG